MLSEQLESGFFVAIRGERLFKLNVQYGKPYKRNGMFVSLSASCLVSSVLCWLFSFLSCVALNSFGGATLKLFSVCIEPFSMSCFHCFAHFLFVQIFPCTRICCSGQKDNVRQIFINITNSR